MEARQEPTFEANVPTDLDGDGDSSIAVASAFFGEPLPWQARIQRIMLARDERDKYRAPTFCMSVPRQNGKSWNVRARCFYGIICCAEKILFTCQHGDTADEMFKDLAAPFEDEENAELNGMLRAVRKTNGQQAIYLKNGGLIRFTTRTNSLARGKSYDILIYDEAQELTGAQQAASLPTISASAKKNTQVIYLGTPPDPECPGTVFRRMHDEAHAGTSTAVWLEWAASEIGDPNDRPRWYETNPSLGPLLNESAVIGEAAGMGPDAFARERLGWWAPGASIELAIPQTMWEGAAIPEIADLYRGRTAFGVKFSADGSTYALAGCKLRGGRSREAAVELVDLGTTEAGTASLARFLWERRSRASAVAVDGLSAASALCDNLDGLKSPRGYVMRPGTQDVISAAQAVIDGLRDGTLAHTPDPALDASATGSARRRIGNRGGWGFGDTEAAQSAAIEAAALALWAARTTRRDPRRKQRLM